MIELLLRNNTKCFYFAEAKNKNPFYESYNG